MRKDEVLVAIDEYEYYPYHTVRKITSPETYDYTKVIRKSTLKRWNRVIREHDKVQREMEKAMDTAEYNIHDLDEIPL